MGNMEYSCNGCGLVWKASEYLYADDMHTLTNFDESKYSKDEIAFIRGTKCPNCYTEELGKILGQKIIE